MVVDCAEVDTFAGIVPFEPVEAFPSVSTIANPVLFAGFPDSTGVLNFTGDFALVAAYALIGALDCTAVVAFTGVLRLAGFFFIPCDTVFAGYELFGRREAVIRTEAFFQATNFCLGRTALGDFAVPSPTDCLSPAVPSCPLGGSLTVVGTSFFYCAIGVPPADHDSSDGEESSFRLRRSAGQSFSASASQHEMVLLSDYLLTACPLHHYHSDLDNY